MAPQAVPTCCQSHGSSACEPSKGQACCVVPGLVKQSEAAEEEDFREIDGTLVGPGGFAVTDDGAVISASKLTVPQLKAELTARGLPTEGKRADLYRRVQVAPSKTTAASSQSFSGYAQPFVCTLIPDISDILQGLWLTQYSPCQLQVCCY